MLSHILTSHIVGSVVNDLVGGGGRPSDQEAQVVTASPVSNKLVGHADASVTQAIGQLQDKINRVSLASGQFGQVSNDDLVRLLESTSDNGKLTRQEYDQIRQFIHGNLDRLSPEARTLWQKVELTLDKQVAGPTGLGAIASAPHAAILKDADLVQFFVELRQEAAKKGSTNQAAEAAAERPNPDGFGIPLQAFSALNNADGFDP
jgi:hypothetical protein